MFFTANTFAICFNKDYLLTYLLKTRDEVLCNVQSRGSPLTPKTSPLPINITLLNLIVLGQTVWALVGGSKILMRWDGAYLISLKHPAPYMLQRPDRRQP